MSTFDELLAPSGAVLKHKQQEVGWKIQGRVIVTPQRLPDNDFQTKQQKVSSKGNPLWQWKVTFEAESETHTVFLNGQAYWDLLNEFRNAGLKQFEDAVGGTFALMRKEDEPSQTPGFSPRKVFAVRFVK